MRDGRSDEEPSDHAIQAAGRGLKLLVRSWSRRESPREAIVTLSTASDDWERWLAARALARSPSAEAIATLLAHLNDRSPPVRGAVARSLGRLGVREAIPALLEQASRPECEAQEAYHQLGALAELREPAAVPLFASLAGSSDRRGRRWVVRCLAMIDGDQALAAIRDLQAGTRRLERARLRWTARRHRPADK